MDQQSKPGGARISAPPWTEDPRNPFDVLDGAGKPIITMLVDDDMGAVMANRRLVIAAPALFVAAKKVARLVFGEARVSRADFVDLLEAIEKAEVPR
jgi:hypothetical protein